MAESTIANELMARPLAEQAVKAIADLAAERAAEKTVNEVAEKIVAGIFLHLGVDVNDKEAMKSLRDDLGFLTRMNRGARELKSAAIKTCVGAVLSGFAVLLWFGFRAYVAEFFSKSPH